MARLITTRVRKFVCVLLPWLGIVMLAWALIFLSKLSPPGLPGTAVKRLLKGDFSAVVIDPGHGGTDDGASGNNLKEKDLTLDLGHKLAAQLRKSGVRAVLTRVVDQYVSLSDRISLANAVPNPIFVSLHVNYADSPVVHGLEIYRAASKNFAGQIRVSFSDTEERLDQAEDQLMHCLAQSIGTDPAIFYRGPKQANFYVTRNLLCPAILIESGFLSNREDALNLSNPRYREQLAERIASGIMAYRSQARGSGLQAVVNSAAPRPVAATTP